MSHLIQQSSLGYVSLGFPFGRSQADAQLALDDAEQARKDARAQLYRFPRAAAKIKAWDDFKALDNGYQLVLTSFRQAPPIITFWGDYVDKGVAYKVQFETLSGNIQQQALADGEDPASTPPGVDGPAGPGGPGGGSDAINWWVIGGIAAAGLILTLILSAQPRTIVVAQPRQ